MRTVSEGDRISLVALRRLAEERFGDLVKVYPDLSASEWIEFDSMINIRPSFGNRFRGVDDPATLFDAFAVAASRSRGPG